MRVLTTALMPSPFPMSQVQWQRHAAEQRQTEQRNARRLAAFLIVLTIAGTVLGVLT